jgi:hypothetical protein
MFRVMNFPRRIIPCLLAGISVLLVSCIDSREEFWIEADGGGRAEIHCTIPAAAALMYGGEEGVGKLIAGFLHSTPSIKKPRHEIVTEDGRMKAMVAFGFDSALDLLETSQSASLDRLPAAATHFFGKTHANWKGRTLEIIRTISPGKALPGAAFMPASQLDGRLVSIMHLPAAAHETNATRTENKGRTLIWETSLADAVKAPVSYRYTMDVPLPWGMIGWIAAPVALLCGAVWIRRTRMSKAA